MLAVTAKIDQNAEEIVVRTTWTSDAERLDRSDGLAWVVTNLAVARRLVAAVDAGAVFGPAEIRADVNGRTYVQASAKVLGRKMNADLCRLGW